MKLVDKRTGEITFDGVRVRSGMPCPICAHLHTKPSWCLIDQARGIVICPRVASERKCGDAGWFHRMDGYEAKVPHLMPIKAAAASIDFGKQWAQARDRITDYDIAKLAERLSLPEHYVRSVPCGMYGSAWAFPMEVNGKVVGLKLRHQDGAKLCVKGSKLGLIIPVMFDPHADEIWLTEGESDLMAAIGAWNINAVARPGCTSCTKEIADLSKRKHLVILCDNDKPGKEGAARLVDACKQARSITVLAPPSKDVREWVKRGAKAADVRWRLKSRRGW